MRFLSYYVGQRHLFFIDMACALVIAVTELAFPQILRQLASGLFTEGEDAILGSLVFIAVGLIAMYALHFFCRVFVISWGHIMGARMESHMREDLFDAYERMGFSYYDRHKTGDLMSRLVSDLFDISETAHHGPEYLVIGVMEIVGSFVILSFINVPLTLVMAAIAIALVVFNFFANVHMRAIFRENRARISNVNTQLEDSLAGIRVVKGFAAEDHERAKFRKSNDAYLDSKARMYFAMGRYHGAIDSMMGILNTTIVVFGGWMIAHGQMRAADLATFALYVSLFTNPISNILNFTETFQKGLAGFQRFVEILDTRPDIEDAPGAPDLRVSAGEIIYDDVRFSYDSGEEVIKGLNLHIEPGKTVALVGPSGGGKSTTCALLPRFYDVQSGSISIDGQDVRGVTQHSLRDAIGLVQQDVYLLTEPLRKILPTGVLGQLGKRLKQRRGAPILRPLWKACLTDMTRRSGSAVHVFREDRSSVSLLPASFSRIHRCSFWMKPLQHWITNRSAQSKSLFPSWQRIEPRSSLHTDCQPLWVRMKLSRLKMGEWSNVALMTSFSQREAPTQRIIVCSLELALKETVLHAKARGRNRV